MEEHKEDQLNLLELAFAAEIWTVKLSDGGEMQVMTHGYEVVDGQYVFSLFFKGNPLVDVAVLRIPESNVMPDQWL